EDHHAVPLGAFAPLPGLPVAPALRRRQRQIADPPTALHRPDLGIPTEIADPDYLVDAACHATCSGLVRISFITLTLPSRQAKHIRRISGRGCAPFPRSRTQDGW